MKNNLQKNTSDQLLEICKKPPQLDFLNKSISYKYINVSSKNDITIYPKGCARGDITFKLDALPTMLTSIFLRNRNSIGEKLQNDDIQTTAF